MGDDPRIIDLRTQGASIGGGVFLGPDVYIEADFAPLLTIEDGVVLARGVCILLHDSALNNAAGEPVKFGRVRLGRNCYIGANTTVACGVEIGAEAIVGASSLVTKDVPPGTVVYGQPAMVRARVSDLTEKHRRLRATSTRFWYLDIVPWRDRRDAQRATFAAQQIRAFLEKKTR